MRDSSSWRAAGHQFARRSCGEADPGVGGVGALVDGRAPQDRVALAVAGDGGVAVAGVGLQQVAVDLDDRDVAQVAGGAAQARPGGAGDRDRDGRRSAGTSAVMAAERVFQSPAGAASQAGAGAAGAVAVVATWRAVLSGSRGGG